jgi:hypothetical protein
MATYRAPASKGLSCLNGDAFVEYIKSYYLTPNCNTVNLGFKQVALWREKLANTNDA